MIDFQPDFLYMVARNREDGFTDEEIAEANDLSIKEMRLRMKMELDTFNAMDRYNILTQYQMFASIFDKNDPEAVTRTAVRFGYPESTVLYVLNKIRELYHINTDKNEATD